MKKMVSLFLIFTFLFTLTGCSSDQKKIYDEIADDIKAEADAEEIMDIAPENHPESEDHLSGKLTVKMYRFKREPPAIYFLAQEFMKLYPDVTIDLDYDIDHSEAASMTEEEKRESENNYYARLRTELLSGDADYMLYDFYASEQLHFYKLAQSGTLLDLRPYWENDPDIDPDDYFMDAMEAFTVDGKMISIPFSFKFTGAFLNRSIMDDLGVDIDSFISVSSDDLLNWYEQALELHPDLQLLFTAPGKQLLYPTEKFSYMDLENKKASFDSPEFIRFLERTNAVISDEPELNPSLIGFGYGVLADKALHYQATNEVPHSDINYEYADQNPEYNIATKARTSLATAEQMNMLQLMNYQQPFEYLAGPYPLTSTTGNLELESYDDFAVPASCKNPDLAWEFIKYCISEREELSFSTHGYSRNNYTEEIPVNRNTFIAMATDMPDYVKRVSFLGYTAFDPVDGPLLAETLEQLLTLNPVDAKQYHINVNDFLDEYYNQETISASQCAGKIQNRIEIWLDE